MLVRHSSRMAVILAASFAVATAGLGSAFAQEANPPQTTKVHKQTDGSTITATVGLGGKVKVTTTDKDGNVTKSETVKVPGAGVKADGCPPNVLC